MKEIIAIIRPKKMGPTKVALERLGFPALRPSRSSAAADSAALPAKSIMPSSRSFWGRGNPAG